MTLENNVYEVGLEWLVDEGKSANYIGRAASATSAEWPHADAI